jgi:hypothetical protein
MDDKPIVEQKKSRRGLLALVGAGGAAAVAALLGKRNGVSAGAGGNFILGTVNDAGTATTSLETNRSGLALRVENDNTTVSGSGVYGGASGSGDGVRGRSFGSSGIGVRGLSDGASGRGVVGSGQLSGVQGSSSNGVGVKGISVSSAGVEGEGRPGVYGKSGGDNASGVRGEGTRPGSIGVLAKNVPTRRALRTKGKVQMDCARKVTLSEMGNTIALPRGVSAATGAAVLAMVQGNPGNDALIRRAFRIDSAHIRITFNKKPANPVSVAYWVVHTG